MCSSLSLRVRRFATKADTRRGQPNSHKIHHELRLTLFDDIFDQLYLFCTHEGDATATHKHIHTRSLYQ